MRGLDRLARDCGIKADHPDPDDFVDIAGLVRGASKGEVLGTSFCANIRNATRLPMFCGALRMGDITMSRGGSTRWRMPETIETS